MIDEKIARLCWNDNYWEKPSGNYGKSKSRNSYEQIAGYGHEEWIFDTAKIIDGFHYGFLQPIHKYWNTYDNRVFNISLYSINSETKEKWWLGKILNVQVISRDESNIIKDKYLSLNWLNEMKEQLVEIGLTQYKTQLPEVLFNIKFKIEDLKLLDDPVKISIADQSIKSYRYMLLTKLVEPTLESNVQNSFSFEPGFLSRDKNRISSYTKRISNITSNHIRITNLLYSYLVDKYGKENVRTDQPTGYGTFIDLCVRNNNEFIFFEIKTATSLKRCIREALGQIIEYSYFPDKNIASKLVIVSQNKPSEIIKLYLDNLRKSFGISLFYVFYDEENRIFSEDY